MKIVLEFLLTSLKNPKTQRNIFLLALVLVIIFFKGCGDGDKDLEILEYKQNISALNDSIRSYKNNNDELVYEKLSLLTDKKNLKKYNKELSKEIKNLKDNPIIITKFVTRIVRDTVRLKPVIDVDGIVFNSDSTVRIIPFEWGDTTKYDEDNYRLLSGKYLIEVDTSLNIKTKEFSILKDEMGISFTTGITENKDDQVEIFIKSNYPGFTPTLIDGALFDPRESEVIKKYFPPKRWGLSVYTGYGVYFDIQNVKFGHGLNLGVGVSYNILQWKGKK